MKNRTHTQHTRRRFCTLAASALIAPLSVRCAGSGGVAQRNATTHEYEHVIGVLTQAGSRIFPGDTQCPDARGLGMETFLRRQCDTPHYVEICKDLRRFVTLLDRRARDECGGTFLTCGEALQDAILEECNSAAVSAFAARMFNIMVDITMEACFCDPRYGGNRDMAGWDIMSSALEYEWLVPGGCDEHK
jgi:hypothetical protein